MRISNKAKRDWNFYLNYPEPIKDFGYQPKFNIHQGEDSAMVCWYQIDTLGKLDVYCNDIPTLKRVLDAKATLNLQIEEWAKDLSDGQFQILRQPELRTMLQSYPKWVRGAVFEYAAKMSVSVRGWIPRFVKYCEHNGVWETPEEEYERECDEWMAKQLAEGNFS